MIMGSKGKDKDFGDCMEIVEEAMEWIAKRWTFSMMKRELREWFPGLSDASCRWILTQAKREIIKRFNIDPKEYKGKQVAFYESIIRGKNEKTRDQLTAAERLDKLFGLESISTEDPALVAAKILEFKRQAEKTVGGQGDGGSKNEGSREVDAGTSTNEGSNGTRREGPSGTSDGSQEREVEINANGKKDGENVLDEITPEDPEIKANIEDVLKKQSKPKEPE